MHIQPEVSLKPHNTFGIDVKAQQFVEVHQLSDLQTLLKEQQQNPTPLLILGGGSNVLFTRDFEGLVAKIKLKGIRLLREDDSNVWLEAAAGEVWHDLVMHCVQKGYGGIENLSLIPGTVGAAPMQNIGAYGVEIKQVLETVQAVERSTGVLKVFTNEECKFGYRESVFKNIYKDQFVITGITLKLSKKPTFNTSYGAIQEVLQTNQVKELSIQAISDAVCQIRSSKLPDPAKIGNAGSFFKNPTIPFTQFEQLKQAFPHIVGYPVANSQVKVPAGWLIEQSGWKGKRFGHIGVHSRQALVLVNYGGGEGSQIRQLSADIQQSVLQKFGIAIQPEINII
ncbi:UDP-N-acetylmuramate dehydrogenase [Microscilla marina]|uniref:UDP-N-acetylenolpyruvoylglucosamine reductase n=1 Tax=Microscilla marina ATCC 23134 TaxID=313606 RepID=A1ZE42_MICM2|nr:UDP-N-acetylmuramate dehydrogenase [Microscilla marina]EAY31350.1 UDP-N-acetylenolpyruvoylglucosamine reductase [Microscilla marina ATCC 23134]